MEDQLKQLQETYCPQIDSALLYALALDYDLNDAASLSELRVVLESLKDRALEEEDAPFDPSGTTNIEDQDALSSPERAQSWHGDKTSASEQTEDDDHAKLHNSLDALQLDTKTLEASEPDLRHERYEDLSQEEKVQALQAMFPTVKQYDITYTLKKAKDDFNRAVEELLNIVLLEDEAQQTGTPTRQKGTDGFLEPASPLRGRKKKGKKSKLVRRTSSTPAPLEHKSTNGVPTASRWDRAKEDVEFITTRTHLNPATVTSLYNKNAGSLSACIAAICRSDMIENPYLEDLSPATLEVQTTKLKSQHPRLTTLQAQTLLQLTFPFTTSAAELADALLSSHDSMSSSTIIPQYLPRPISPDHEPYRSSSSTPSNLPINSNLAALRSQAQTQASSAHRLSKSNALFSGAAAYYSSVSRDAASALRSQSSASARALVTAQSRFNELDLHGVTVRDAVAITRERVNQWWLTQGAAEYVRAGKVRDGAALRVIVGKGQHSEGGRGKLGPAVGAMLVREGWRAEVGSGVIDVVGRARKS